MAARVASIEWGPAMWWGMGFVFAIIWITMLFVLGFSTYANGHKMLFWIGIIFPVLWIVGAFWAPKEAPYA